MTSYEGPAGVHLSPDDALEVWKLLALHPTAENDDLRRRLHDYLENDGKSRRLSDTPLSSSNVD